MSAPANAIGDIPIKNAIAFRVYGGTGVTFEYRRLDGKAHTYGEAENPSIRVSNVQALNYLLSHIKRLESRLESIVEASELSTGE